MSLRCKSCGAAIPANSTECEFCNTSADGPQVAVKKEDDEGKAGSGAREKSGRVGMVVLVLVGLAGLGVFFATQSTPPPAVAPVVETPKAEPKKVVVVQEPAQPQRTHEVFGTVQDVKEPWLNLRDQPSVKGSVVGQLPDGTGLIWVRSSRGKWAEVRVADGPFAGRTGYLNTKWVRASNGRSR